MNTDGQQNSKKWSPVLVYLTGIVGVLYLLNPSSGVLELIPDNLPLVGNLDEGAAALLVWNAIQQIRTMGKKK